MDENGIKGYKAFYKNLVNQNGMSFEIGKRYVCEEEYQNYGFHFCKRLEDVFVYYRGMDTEICEVVGYGNVVVYDNDYYGVYDVYATSEIEIIRKISREEIISMMIHLSYYSYDRVIRFVSLCKLSKEEIMLFKKRYAKYDDIVDAIRCYQEGDSEVYVRRYQKKYK